MQASPIRVSVPDTKVTRVEEGVNSKVAEVATTPYQKKVKFAKVKRATVGKN